MANNIGLWRQGGLLINCRRFQSSVARSCPLSEISNDVSSALICSCVSPTLRNREPSTISIERRPHFFWSSRLRVDRKGVAVVRRSFSVTVRQSVQSVDEEDIERATDLLLGNGSAESAPTSSPLEHLIRIGRSNGRSNCRQ